jgi:predicted TIM-barrel fold metal-dependent hydrolase
MRTVSSVVFLAGLLSCSHPPRAEMGGTSTCDRIRGYLDTVPLVDTHDHLYPYPIFSKMMGIEPGKSVNLASFWHHSYYRMLRPIPPWTPETKFEDWWPQAKAVFEDGKGTTFYRYLLPAFRDLYGVDFDHLSLEEARALDRRISDNYRESRWLSHVVTERANIELMFVDPPWARLALTTYYPFEVLVFNVTSLVRGFHPSEFGEEFDDPYAFARRQGMGIHSLNDYLELLDRLFQAAKKAGAVCLKSTLAYQRTLSFENVPQSRAEQVFGRKRTDLSADEVRAFEDFIQWRLVTLSAKYDLPFQFHTGVARPQGSNPMLLADLIEANPKTKFILMHGGYPWLGETAVLAMKFSSNVWVDTTWLATLSHSAAKRAFHEWLETIPSDRLMFGADSDFPEEIYGSVIVMRRCLAEVLAEKVDAGDLEEAHALKIGRRILRENALKLFPNLRHRLWKKPAFAGDAAEQ